MQNGEQQTYSINPVLLSEKSLSDSLVLPKYTQTALGNEVSRLSINTVLISLDVLSHFLHCLELPFCNIQYPRLHNYHPCCKPLAHWHVSVGSWTFIFKEALIFQCFHAESLSWGRLTTWKFCAYTVNYIVSIS